MLISGFAALRAARLGGRVVLVISAGLAAISPSDTAALSTAPMVTAILWIEFGPSGFGSDHRPGIGGAGSMARLA